MGEQTEVSAKGHNGTVSFDGDFVTIARKGGLARMTIGKGDKRIPVHSITAVQWKPPGAVMNGFIAFTLGGGNEGKSRFGSQTIDATKDENAVIVTKKQADDFLRLRNAIEAAIAERGRPQPAQVIHQQADSPLDQLKQLGELRDAGVLSEEEFAAKKAEILGRM